MKQQTLFSRQELLGLENHSSFECPVCLDILFMPVTIGCQKHIFCQDCAIFLKSCPICRKNVINVEPHYELRQQLNQLKYKCPNNCGFVNYEQLEEHKIFCTQIPLQNQIDLKLLLNICEKQKEIINLEINPHLQKEHTKIYNDFVQDWKWLIYLNKDWKWWWWSHTSWWNNSACKVCNELWHKYDDDVLYYENQRINLLKE